MNDKAITPGPVTRLAVNAIRLYQRRLRGVAAATGSRCRYAPSCSRYGELAYLRYGVIWGTLMTAWRLIRCNPWGGHGWDPVPERRDGRADPIGSPVYPAPADGVCPVCEPHQH